MQTVNERYLFKPFPGSSHFWALGFLQKQQRNLRILDVGIGSAGLARELRNLGFSDLSGAEPDAQARNLAKDVYKKLEPNISGYKGESFQVILLMDVLEHCAQPELMLHSCLELLSAGGYMLISVPNVAHWSVRIPLLFGQFKYKARGILDRTHLRFFTRQTFKEFIANEAKLSAEQLCVSIEPLELVLPKIVWDNAFFAALSKARVSLANILPGFLGYQHLALLKRVN